MISVNGLPPYVRAILDSFNSDYDGVWFCPCGWRSDEAGEYTLLGIVDEAIKHAETDVRHNV